MNSGKPFGHSRNFESSANVCYWSRGRDVDIWVEKNQIGASGIGLDLSVVGRCSIAGRAFMGIL